MNVELPLRCPLRGAWHTHIWRQHRDGQRCTHERRTTIARNMCTAHRHGLAPCKRPELSHGLSMHATVPTLPHATSARKASGARNDGVAATAFELPAAACSVCDMFSSCLATSAPALASASALTLPVRPRAQCAGQQAPLCLRAQWARRPGRHMRARTGRGWHRPLHYESLREY